MRCSICHRSLPPDATCADHDVVTPGPASEDEAPEVAGFTLGRQIGKGGFATVYLASASEPVAYPELAVKVASQRGDPRMGREVRALQRVGPPAVPGFVATGVIADGRPFIAMEYVSGDSLSHRLQARSAQGSPGTWDRQILLDDLVAIGRALEHIHAAGVVHRDLKPENILFRANAQAAIIDLGLAHLRQQADEDADLYLTRTEERLGTYSYMAPEQWMGHRSFDERTDLYALGVIAFELFTGRLPFVGDPAAVRHGHVSARCPRPSEFAPLPAGLDDAIVRCLAKDRKRRWATVGAFLDAALAAAKQASEPVGGAPVRPARASARRRLIALLSLHTAAGAARLGEFAHRHGAAIAGVDGDHYVLAFPWASSVVGGARSAIAASRAAGSLAVSDPCVVHVAEIRIRRRKRGLRLSGPALDQPSAWASPGQTSGIVLTRDAARVIGERDVVPIAGDDASPDAAGGFFRLVAAQQDVRLLDVDPQRVMLQGRDTVLIDLVFEACQSRVDGTPVLSTIEADIGMGKTRLLHALAITLRGQGDARVHYLQASTLRETSPEGTARHLLRLTLGLPEPCSLDDIDAAWDRLGDRPVEAGRWATAYLLRAVSRSAQPLQPILQTPGAFRQASARALALALTCAARQQPLFLLIDDAHAADHIALDALELATMGDPPVSIAAWVSAQPALYAARPRWGDRAAAGGRHTLEPLDRDQARTLLLDLLRPVEFVPESVLTRLYELSSGVPLYLAELAMAARKSGAIRQHHTDSSGYYIAADELLRATELSIDERLAEQALDAVPAPLVPLAQLCAVLGDFSERDVLGVQSVLGQDRYSAIEVDAAVGLDRLARLGIIEPRQHGYAIRHAVLGGAIERLTPADRRTDFHAAVVKHWQASSAGDPARLAHHAARAGNTDLAARTYVDLAEDSRDHHRYVEAEQQYTLALEHLDNDHDLRGQALSGRGRVRYRLQRLSDALDDLRGAYTLAEQTEDTLEQARLLLEQATVLDHSYQWEQSAELADVASKLVEPSRSEALIASLHLARGRAALRRGQFHDAIELLDSAAIRAEATEQIEVHIISLLLIAPALVFVERFEESEERFHQVLHRCREVGDDFHLAMAYLNRQALWFMRGELDNLISDGQITMNIGRLLGNVKLEHDATYNVAEALYWSGSFDRAYALCERALDLYLRFLSSYVDYDDHLLLARIFCSRGELEARNYLQWIEDNCDANNLSPTAHTLISLVRLAIATLEQGAVEPAPWRNLSAEARANQLSVEHIEILIMAAELSCHLGNKQAARSWQELAPNAAANSRLWVTRLEILGRRLTAM